MRPGPTRYTEVGGAQVAYQVTGDGPVDLIYMMGTGSNFAGWWDFPPYAAMLDRFASFSRLILFDQRGNGSSDPPSAGELPTWEEHSKDLRAVMDAVGSTQATIVACFSAGPVALNFAATDPDRVRALVLWNTFARFYEDAGYEIGAPADSAASLTAMLEQLWGTPDMIGVLLPSYAADPVAVEWHGRILRGGCTPRSFAQQTEALFGVDARPALSHIRCPVLSLSTAGSVMPPPAVSRYMADHVADGEYLEVAGPDLDIWASPDSREILDRIETYATGRVAAAGTDRVLAAVLFTDIVGSTERLAEIGDLKWKSVLDRHDLRAQGIVERWRGRIVDTAGDGVLAMFDGPGAALRAALEFQAAMAVDDIHLRAGVHFGEVELRTGGEVGGLAVHLAARVMSLAGASELYCTRTVKELALGADVDFVDCGEQALKGIPEPWQVFRVAQAH